MKRSVLLVLFCFMLIGCNENNITKEKEEYLVFKEELLKQTEFTNQEDIKFDIKVSVDRITDEEISYRAIIDNPKENINNMKAIVVHDYLTNDIFPSIGIFDDGIDLLVGNEEIKGVNLAGYIQTTKDINELNLNIKVYVEYNNDEGDLVKVYYKSTK